MRIAPLLVILIAAALMSPLHAETVLKVVTENTPLTKSLSEEPGGGEATEFVERLLQTANVNYQLNYMPWRRGYQQARSNSNVLIFPLARTPERETQFHWVSKLLPIQYYLFQLKARDDLNPSDIEDTKHNRIGVVNYHAHHEYLIGRGFEQLQPVNNSVQNIKKLMLGRIDFFAMSDGGIFPLCKRVQIDCNLLKPAAELEGSASGLYLAAGLGTDPEILKRIEQAHRILVEDGTRGSIFAKRTDLLRQFHQNWNAKENKMGDSPL